MYIMGGCSFSGSRCLMDKPESYPSLSTSLLSFERRQRRAGSLQSGGQSSTDAGPASGRFDTVYEYGGCVSNRASETCKRLGLGCVAAVAIAAGSAFD